MDRLIKIKNSKILFTPGPASLIKENVFNINPAFGRGDPQYLKMQNKVLEKLKKCQAIRILFQHRDQEVQPWKWYLLTF